MANLSSPPSLTSGYPRASLAAIMDIGLVFKALAIFLGLVTAQTSIQAVPRLPKIEEVETPAEASPSAAPAVLGQDVASQPDTERAPATNIASGRDLPTEVPNVAIDNSPALTESDEDPVVWPCVIDPNECEPPAPPPPAPIPWPEPIWCDPRIMALPDAPIADCDPRPDPCPWPIYALSVRPCLLETE